MSSLQHSRTVLQSSVPTQRSTPATPATQRSNRVNPYYRSDSDDLETTASVALMLNNSTMMYSTINDNAGIGVYGGGSSGGGG